jgi:hypothetical protein
VGRVTDKPTFDAEQFLALPVKDRVRLCRQLAARAQELADAAESEASLAYLEIAKQWLTLAGEMERAAADMENIKTGY